MDLKDIRQDDGKLPSYAWPGCYPIVYVCKDGGELCPDCANGENGSEATRPDLDPSCPGDLQWIVSYAHIHYEGAAILCDHCGKEIESAYGDPEISSPAL